MEEKSRDSPAAAAFCLDASVYCEAEQRLNTHTHTHTDTHTHVKRERKKERKREREKERRVRVGILRSLFLSFGFDCQLFARFNLSEDCLTIADQGEREREREKGKERERHIGGNRPANPRRISIGSVLSAIGPPWWPIHSPPPPPPPPPPPSRYEFIRETEPVGLEKKKEQRNKQAS